MPKLSKPKSFSVSNEIIEVDFQGTIVECANLLKSGIVNQTIVLVDNNDKWHEINVLNLGGDDSNLQAFKNFVETMKLTLTDLGIVSESVKKIATFLTYADFENLSEKFPPHDYIEISLLNDYNVKCGGKSSIDELTDWLKVCKRDNISIKQLINNREIEKLKSIMNTKEVQELEVREAGQTAIPVESKEVPVGNIEVHEAVIVELDQESYQESNQQSDQEQQTKPAKKPISIQVFETLTPERISELQGLNESQLAIVKKNPVIHITDKKTHEAAKKTAAILLKASTAIDGKDGMAMQANKYLNTFKDMLKNAFDPLAKLTRNPYDEQKSIISAWENAELLREQAEQRLKLEKIKKRTDELFAVPFTFNGSIYSIGTIYCTPSQVETATDEDFLVIVNDGKTIKTALDAEAELQAGKDKEIADLKAKLAALTAISEMSNTDIQPEKVIPTVVVQKPINNGPTEVPSSNTVVNPVKTAIEPVTTPAGNTASKPGSVYVLPAPENELLNRLDLKNASHLENPNYLKCRGYYVQALKDVAGEIEFILNDATPNAVKKSERISILCEILKKSV